MGYKATLTTTGGPDIGRCTAEDAAKASGDW